MIYVDGGAGGNIDVTIRYSNGTIDTQYKSLYVNTVDVARVDFAPTGGWTKFANKVVTIKLNSGSNTIKISRDGDDTGGTDLDYLYVPIGKASTKP